MSRGLPPNRGAGSRKAAPARATIRILWPLAYDAVRRILRIIPEDKAWAKINGSPAAGGKYPAIEQIPAAAGGWTNGPRTWTLSGPVNPLTEINGVMTVGLVVVRARRAQDGSWRFTAVC